MTEVSHSGPSLRQRTFLARDLAADLA